VQNVKAARLSHFKAYFIYTSFPQTLSHFPNHCTRFYFTVKINILLKLFQKYFLINNFIRG